MIDFIDHIPGTGKNGRRKITYEDGTQEYVIMEMADEAISMGTPLNRHSLMSIQGMEGYVIDTVDGQIIQTFGDGSTLRTIKNNDGSITQTFTGGDSQSSMTKTTRLVDGKIIATIT